VDLKQEEKVDMDTQDSYSGGEPYEVKATDTAEMPTVGSSRKKGRSASAKMEDSTATDVKQEVQDTAGQVIGQAQETVGKVVDQVKGSASSQLSNQKDRVAETIGSVAQVIRSASEGLQNQDQWSLAEYTDNAATRAEQLSDYLRNRDLREISIQVEHFARRQPTLFLAGAFGVGLLAARFLKSSAQAQQSSSYVGSNRAQSSNLDYSGGQGSASIGYSDYENGTGSQAGMDEMGYSPTMEETSLYEEPSYDGDRDAVQTEG